MSRFWNRHISVTVYSQQAGQAVTWTDLAVSFQVTLGSQAGPSTVSIKNLSDTSRGALDMSKSRLTLRAGYDDDPAIAGGVLPLIIDADIVRSEHRPPPTGWNSDVTLQPGYHARNVRLAQSFAGASMADVACSLADALASSGHLDVGDFKAGVRRTQWGTVAASRVVDGPALPSLKKLIEGSGYQVQVIDTKLVLVPPDDQVDGTAVRVSQDSGMIASPKPIWSERLGRRTPDALEVSMKLSPMIRPGSAIMLESRLYSGFYTVFSVTHAGDNYGGAFDTTVKVRRRDAGSA